jgi:acyl carrier protein
MTKEKVFEDLKEIITAVRPSVDVATITYESTLLGDLSIDSLSMLLLSLATENKFNIRFDSNNEPFKTVGDVCDYVVQHCTT